MPSSALSLFEPSPSRRVGIARLAAQGESLRQARQVEYLSLPVRSLLNRCDSARVPFPWTINPYRGCEFACQYCYARYTHEFMELRDPAAFEHQIYVKQNAGWLLRRDLRRVKPGEEIAIGTATDPYQPAERQFEVTRGILEELARHHGLTLSLITKSNLVVRDLELLQEIARHNRLGVSVTVTTLDARLARILEPRAPRPDLRLEAVRRLSQAGIVTSVSCCPVLPGITDKPRDLEAVVRAAAQAGARHLFANPLFLKPCSASVFLPFLDREFPALVQAYRRRYADRAFLPASYRKRIAQLVSGLKRKYGLAGRLHSEAPREYPAGPGALQQLALFP